MACKGSGVQIPSPPLRFVPVPHHVAVCSTATLACVFACVPYYLAAHHVTVRTERAKLTLTVAEKVQIPSPPPKPYRFRFVSPSFDGDARLCGVVNALLRRGPSQCGSDGASNADQYLWERTTQWAWPSALFTAS